MFLTQKAIYRVMTMLIICIISLVVLGNAEETKKSEKEAKLSKKDLPAAVLGALQKTYPKAVIKEVGKEEKDSILCFEVESVDGKMERNLVYTADGKTLEIEEKIDLKDLPEAARLVLSADYPKAEIKRAEKVTRGVEVTYEVSVGKEKTRAEVVFDSTGKVIKPEKASPEQEEDTDND